MTALKSKNKQNYNLFDKCFSKISDKTIKKFTSVENLGVFLQEISDSGNVAAASKKLSTMHAIQIQHLIREDRYFAKCVTLSLAYAAEVAEGILYDRAINGYEELSYNRAGDCIARKKKYCSKSLLEYLKANSLKYQSKKEKQNPDVNTITKITSFEIEDYGAEESAR